MIGDEIERERHVRQRPSFDEFDEVFVSRDGG